MPPKKKSAIPDRWTDYTAVGKRIPGTRFIAFKVPLKQSFRRHLTQSEAFGPFDLVNMLEEEGQELGLIIDLTFTTRYYKPQDLPETLYYLKIFTAGHEVPNDATILSFKKGVRRFLRENENNDKLIGVHCTHGLNRTGYLVCRYLIDVDGMEPRNAIDLFNASRGHSIERQNYIDDLNFGPKRSNAGIEEPDKDPVQGHAGLTQHDAPPHRNEQYNHYPAFNGRELYPGDRELPRYEYASTSLSSYHEQNHMRRYEPPFQQHCPPPLLPNPPPAMRLPRPFYPNQSFRGGHFCPPHPYPPPPPHHMSHDPFRFPPPFPSEESMGPQASHRKPRHRRWKGKKNKTSVSDRDCQ